MFVQCLLSKEFWWGSKKRKKEKKNRVALTSGDLELNTWLPFHSLKKFMLRRAENLAGVLSFF